MLRRLLTTGLSLSLLVILGCLACGPLLLPSVTALPRDTDEVVVHFNSKVEGGPARVKVGIYILNIGKLDTSTGAYTVDFYLALTSDKVMTIEKFEFANGRATLIDKSVDEPTEKFYRIQAALVSTLNLSRYPFDRHQLTIEIEDKEHTINSLLYEVSREDSGLDPAVKLAGWDITGWDAKVEDHYYSPWQTTFSKYIFSMQIKRSGLAAILKTILPALVIIFVGLLSLVLSPDKIIPRLTLTTGAFTSAVMFHLNMTSSLPPLGYLTFGDRFMIFNYFGLAAALISTLIALRYVDKKNNAAADKVHKSAIVVVPVFWIVLQAINFIML